jgi:hypothetical protein
MNGQPRHPSRSELKDGYSIRRRVDRRRLRGDFERPPDYLRAKPLPEWSNAERRRFEPPGYVWNRDCQTWVVG